MPELLSAVPTITARDVPAAIAFWVNALGFRLVFSMDGFASVARDRVRLYIAEGDGASTGAAARVWMVVEDIDGLHAEWSRMLPADNAEGPSLTGIVEQAWGRGFAVRDRAGNDVYFVDQSLT